MENVRIKKLTACLVAIVAAAVMMVALCACAPKEVTVKVVDGDASTEVTTQEGKTVSEVLSAADITVNEGDEVDPALDSKIEGEGKTITIQRMNNVVVAVDGKNVDVAILGGTVQDALDKAEVTLANGDKVDVEVTTPLADEMIITVTRAQKEQGATTKSGSSSSSKASSSSSSKSSSASKPAAQKTIVSKTKVPNCDDASHGYYEITWSDGSTTYEEY